MPRKKSKKPAEVWFRGKPPDLQQIPGLIVYAEAWQDQIHWGASGRHTWSILTEYQDGTQIYHATVIPLAADLGVLLQIDRDGLIRVQVGAGSEDPGFAWSGCDALCRVVPAGCPAVGERITRYHTPQRPAWALPKSRRHEVARADTTSYDLSIFELVGGYANATASASDS